MKNTGYFGERRKEGGNGQGKSPSGQAKGFSGFCYNFEHA